MDKLAIINRIKRSYKSIRIAGIRPTGVLATRALVLVMLVPMILVVAQYVCYRRLRGMYPLKRISLSIRVFL